jgi:CheY-like chemotaxis protein
MGDTGTAAGNSEESLRGKGQHLLVVDDELILREIASEILGEHGYRVHAVASGEEAVEFIKENPVDLVLLDMIMEPGINGRETYVELLRIDPQLKVIVVSGYSQNSEVEETIRLGSGRFLKKPYSSTSLLQAVRDELGS